MSHNKPLSMSRRAIWKRHLHAVAAIKARWARATEAERLLEGRMLTDAKMRQQRAKVRPTGR